MTDSLRFTSFFIYFCLVTVQWILCCFTDKYPPAGRGGQEAGVSGTLSQAKYLYGAWYDQMFYSIAEVVSEI